MRDHTWMIKGLKFLLSTHEKFSLNEKYLLTPSPVSLSKSESLTHKYKYIFKIKESLNFANERTIEKINEDDCKKKRRDLILDNKHIGIDSLLCQVVVPQHKLTKGVTRRTVLEAYKNLHHYEKRK